MAEPVQIYRPVWCDPRFVGVLNDHTVSVITVPSTGINRVALNDPTRWAIGFMRPEDTTVPTLGFLSLSPTAGAGGWGFGNGPIWLNLFTHGTIVTGEWYAHELNDFVLTIVEVRASN